MNYKIKLLFLYILTLLLSCGQDQISNTNPPFITSIIPSIARIGDTITISGSKFGEKQNTNYISFNSFHASNYIYWCDSLIILKVPSGATTGKLFVQNGMKSNEVNFTINYTYVDDSIKIGNQIWMSKNLDVCLYSNGDSIPQVTDPSKWKYLRTGAWCYYDNDPTLDSIYGKLYNWYAVNDIRGLAPLGWHIPSDEEWTILTSYLNGESVAGGKLKETGTAHWQSPNTNATNESGFTALPGGGRYYEGSFGILGIDGNWWSSTQYDNSDAFLRTLGNDHSHIISSQQSKSYGFSIRCIKD